MIYRPICSLKSFDDKCTFWCGSWWIWIFLYDAFIDSKCKISCFTIYSFSAWFAENAIIDSKQCNKSKSKTFVYYYSIIVLGNLVIWCENYWDRLLSCCKKKHHWLFVCMCHSYNLAIICTYWMLVVYIFHILHKVNSQHGHWTYFTGIMFKLILFN